MAAFWRLLTRFATEEPQQLRVDLSNKWSEVGRNVLRFTLRSPTFGQQQGWSGRDSPEML